MTKKKSNKPTPHKNIVQKRIEEEYIYIYIMQLFRESAHRNVATSE
jgi:hypothetical protein